MVMPCAPARSQSGSRFGQAGIHGAPRLPQRGYVINIHTQLEHGSSPSLC
jgi:hypothetical protein